MYDTVLQRRRLADIEEAIDRAKQVAAEQEVPLTVERLAAELEMELSTFRRIVEGKISGSSPGMTAKITAIRRAAGEATASVMEHAMRRGTSPNMHLLYLKNHAGYEGDKGGRMEEKPLPPVIFLGEEAIPD